MTDEAEERGFSWYNATRPCCQCVSSPTRCRRTWWSVWRWAWWCGA